MNKKSWHFDKCSFFRFNYFNHFLKVDAEQVIFWALLSRMYLSSSIHFHFNLYIKFINLESNISLWYICRKLQFENKHNLWKCKIFVIFLEEMLYSDWPTLTGRCTHLLIFSRSEPDLSSTGRRLSSTDPSPSPSSPRRRRKESDILNSEKVETADF